MSTSREPVKLQWVTPSARPEQIKAGPQWERAPGKDGRDSKGLGATSQICNYRVKSSPSCTPGCCCCSVTSVASDSLRLHGLRPTSLLCLWDSPGKNIGVGCHALLQGIFPTQELNWALLHCRWILVSIVSLFLSLTTCSGERLPWQSPSLSFKKHVVGVPGGLVVKNSPANTGNMSSIPGPGRAPVPWSS